MCRIRRVQVPKGTMVEFPSWPMGPEVVSGKKMGEDSFHGSLVGCVKHAIPGLQGYRVKG